MTNLTKPTLDGSANSKIHQSPTWSYWNTVANMQFIIIYIQNVQCTSQKCRRY